MIENWNPQVEHLEGVLCERGLMRESYDEKSGELMRELTIGGIITSQQLLKKPKWKMAYVALAKEEFKKYPKQQQKELWKIIANQIK